MQINCIFIWLFKLIFQIQFCIDLCIYKVIYVCVWVRTLARVCLLAKQTESNIESTWNTWFCGHIKYCFSFHFCFVSFGLKATGKNLPDKSTNSATGEKTNLWCVYGVFCNQKEDLSYELLLLIFGGSFFFFSVLQLIELNWIDRIGKIKFFDRLSNVCYLWQFNRNESVDELSAPWKKNTKQKSTQCFIENGIWHEICRIIQEQRERERGRTNE